MRLWLFYLLDHRQFLFTTTIKILYIFLQNQQHAGVIHINSSESTTNSETTDKNFMKFSYQLDFFTNLVCLFATISNTILGIKKSPHNLGFINFRIGCWDLLSKIKLFIFTFIYILIAVWCNWSKPAYGGHGHGFCIFWILDS